MGVFEHLYDENFFETDGCGTHYLVLAYQIVVSADDFSMNQLPTEQHEKFRWFNEDNINTIDNAHPSSIEYFKYTSGNDVQYRIVATRRGIYDTLLWQTPVLSLTAQAFLFSISLGSDASQWERRTAAVLALIASIASIQLTSSPSYS